MRYGLSLFDFWKMTYGELATFIEQASKAEIINLYSQANLISSFVVNNLNGKKNPSLESMYPDLFGGQSVNEEEQSAAYTNFVKDQWIVAAQHYNKMRKQKEGDGLSTSKN